MKKWALMVLIGVMAGCGGGGSNNGPVVSGGIDDNLPLTTTKANIEINGPVQTFIDLSPGSPRQLIYLGELKNVGDKPACNVSIDITAEFIGFTDPIPTTITAPVQAIRLNHPLGFISSCLMPGEFGGFKAWFPQAVFPVSKASWKFNGSTGNIPDFPVDRSDVVLCGPIERTIDLTTGRIDPNNGLTYWGINYKGALCNNSSQDIYEPMVTFVIFNDGQVRNAIDLDVAWFGKSVCPVSLLQPEIISTRCLKSGESDTFDITLYTSSAFWIPASREKEIMSYHKISYGTIQ